MVQICILDASNPFKWFEFAFECLESFSNGSTLRSTILFDKDKIYAYLNLDDNELFIYQRLYDLLSTDVVAPDLVVYLQAPSDLLRRRARRRRERDAAPPLPGDEYLGELNEAYNHFFFHYDATPLLVVETSQLALEWGDDAMDDLVKQLRGMGGGTQYYVPRTGDGAP